MEQEERRPTARKRLAWPCWSVGWRGKRFKSSTASSIRGHGLTAIGPVRAVFNSGPLGGTVRRARQRQAIPWRARWRRGELGGRDDHRDGDDEGGLDDEPLRAQSLKCARRRRGGRTGSAGAGGRRLRWRHRPGGRAGGAAWEAAAGGRSRAGTAPSTSFISSLSAAQGRSRPRARPAVRPWASGRLRADTPARRAARMRRSASSS